MQRQELRQQCQELGQERQALLRRQAALLAEHVAVRGLPLPASGGAAHGAERREQLVAQLTQEEGAARAALEALKQGSTLAKAREVGLRVQCQARELAAASSARSGGDGSAAAVAWPPAGCAVGACSVLLAAPSAEEAAAAAAAAVAAAAAADVMGEDEAPQQARQEQDLVTATAPPRQSVLDARGRAGTSAAGQRALGVAAGPTAWGGCPAAAEPPGCLPPLRQQQEQEQQQQQQRYSIACTGRQDSGGAAGSARPSDVAALQSHLAALQAAVDRQQAAAAAAAAANAGPWGQLLPAVTVAALLASNPAAAAGAVAGAGGGALGLLSGAVPASAAAPVPPEQPLAADPVLAAAVAEHTRHMACLRMELERVRGATELESLRAQLRQLAAASQGAGGAGGAPPLEPAAVAGGVPRPTSAQSGSWSSSVALPHPAQAEAARALLPDEGPDAPAGGPAEHQGARSAAPEGPAAADGWPEGAAGHTTSTAGSGGALEAVALARWSAASAAAALADVDEVLAPEEESAVLAARGSSAGTDILQVHVASAGPFSRRGTYRLAVALYEGFQAVEGAAGEQVCASTSRRLVAPAGLTGAAAAAAAAGGAADGAAGSGSTGGGGSAAAAHPGVARFQESLVLKGVRLSPSAQLVFELHCSRSGLAGLPTKEALVGWATAPLLQGGQVLPGTQSAPLFRLPLMLAAARKFTFDGGAMVDFRLSHLAGAPGDVELGSGRGSGVARGPGSGDGGGPGASGGAHEDIPGVPCAAWVRVQRGVPPSDPYTPGDGLVVLLDAARFLPLTTTVSRVSATVWSSGGALLAGPFEGVSQPDGDAFSPTYAATATLGALHSGARLEDPTATLMLQVHTIERTSRALRVVGFALLALFLDPKTGAQPVSRSIQDYVLNQGAFQLPLHAGAPPTSAPLRMGSLDSVPRLPCASVLVCIATPEAARQARRAARPAYADRVYDTVSRANPTALERRMYAHVLAGQPWPVHEAARLVAWFRRQPGGLGGSSKRAAREAAAPGGGELAARQPSQTGGLLARVFGGAGAGGDADALAAAARLFAGDPAAAAAERPEHLEEAKAEPLPPSDAETADMISGMMDEAAAATLAATPGAPSAPLRFINANTARAYCPQLGFFGALDGATRLARLLPAAGLMSASPPGSLYQDHPAVDDVRVTLDYDLDAPLAAPRWLDGYQQFAGLAHHAGLVLLADVRCLVPGSASSAPLGWACLPVFEPCGPYVASGSYQLPLFQGVPSHQLLSELSASGDPDGVMCAALRSGRVRPCLECSSVLLRLMCGTRQGQLEAPAWTMPLQELRLPRYAASELGPRYVAEMRKPVRNRTYREAKPRALTDEQWCDLINDSLIKVAGLDAVLDGRHSGDEGEELAVPASVWQEAAGAAASKRASAARSTSVASRRSDAAA